MSAAVSETKRRRSRRTCCCGCGAAFLVVAAVLLFLLFTPPPGPPPMTPEQRAHAEAKVATVKKELEQVKVAHDKGERHPFKLTMTEQDINTYLQLDEHVQELLQRAKIENAYVRIEDGKMRATATRPVRGAPMTGTVGLEPTIGPDGRVKLHITSVHVGRLGLPATGSRYLDDDFMTSMAQKALDQSLKFDSVKVEGDSIVLSGDAR